MNGDTELLLQYSRGQSQTAFAELVRRHLPGVYSAALRRLNGDTHLAQDVTQKVFVALARKAEAVARHPFLSSWLYTAARHEAANLVRGEQRRRHRELEHPTMEESTARSASAADWSRVAPVVDQAIDQLSEGDRRVILLRFVEQRTFGEIARTFGISEDAARMRNERALDKVRSELTRRGFASTSAVLGATLSANAIAAVPHGLEAAVTGAALAAGSAPLATTGIAATLTGVLLSPTVGLVSVMVAALVAAGYEFRQRQAATTELSATQSQYQASLEHLRSSERALADLDKRPLTPQTENAAATPPAASSASNPRAAGEAFMVRHPEVRQALLDYLDATNHAKYSALFRSLNLSPDQIRQFEALVRKGSFGRDLQSGGVITLPSGSMLSAADRKAGLLALLGQDGYAQYTAFNERLPGRAVAANLTSLLVATDASLTVGQAQQVADIFWETANPQHRDQYNWEAALEKAQGTLSPSQLLMLQNLHRQEVGWQKVDSPSP